MFIYSFIYLKTYVYIISQKRNRRLVAINKSLLLNHQVNTNIYFNNYYPMSEEDIVWGFPGIYSLSRWVSTVLGNGNVDKEGKACLK